jgi:hypothetical protein
MCLIAGGALAVMSGPSAGAQSNFGQATEVPAPSNAPSNPYATLEGVSCTSAGNCVGVGSYGDSSSGPRHAMVATETGGTWGEATNVTLPSNAASASLEQLSGVSCTSAGNCVAVGDYFDRSTGIQAMAVTETGGTWAQATEVTLPSNALSSPSSPAGLSGVSCTSAGNCVGVGRYQDSPDSLQAMAVTETGGTFGQATEVTLPSNAASNPPIASLVGVSCTSAGNCVAVGGYTDSSQQNQAMAATETGGAWGQATEVTGAFGLFGVSCPSAGNCVAVGGSDSSGNEEAAAAGTLLPTTTTLSSSANPSYVGQPVTLTATVTPTSGTGTPTGTVTFSQGTTSLGTATLNSSGQATITTSALAPGADPITASYSGDTNFAPSTSSTLTQTVTGCPTGDTAHLLTATTNVGTIYGLFCVNSTGFGTYQQGSAAGFGVVVVRSNSTAIGAIGPNLALLGAITSSFSPFVELAPVRAQGTFVLG